VRPGEDLYQEQPERISQGVEKEHAQGDTFDLSLKTLIVLEKKSDKGKNKRQPKQQGL
jgi:hypothetical protein